MTERIKTYSVMEACEALRIKRTTLYKLFARRQLKKVKLCGRTVIREVDLARLLEKQAR